MNLDWEKTKSQILLVDAMAPQVLKGTDSTRPEPLRPASANTKQAVTPETARRSSNTNVSYLPRPVPPAKESLNK